jgi:hypothetical protein
MGRKGACMPVPAGTFGVRWVGGGVLVTHVHTGMQVVN